MRAPHDAGSRGSALAFFEGSLVRQAIFSADDFGLSLSVNEGIERAHRYGVLGAASLMVAGAAADDAVRRARAMPELRIGLHLVVIEGPAVLPVSDISALVDGRGQFPSDQLGLGLRYAFSAAARRQLEAEIRAQFRAFAATGLKLDHADAHKHMHLHPVVGAMMLRIGREFGLRAIRIPHEPAGPLRAAGTRPGIGAAMLRGWTRLLRAQARRAGMVVNDHVFGLAWSGHMTAERLLRLVPHLPKGISEVYFHPAAGRDAVIDALMPDYEHAAELAALCDPRLLQALSGIALTNYAEINAAAR
jgi:hopanoid biosynthesis associated protein HpnK